MLLIKIYKFFSRYSLFKIKEKHFFFLAYALNSLAISFFIFFSGLIGKFQISSYTAIAQSFSMLLFAVFSMNLRSIILTKSETIAQKYIFLRLVFFFPFIFLFYIFSLSQSNWFFVFSISVKRLFDWIEEINLALAEKNNDIYYLLSNLFLNLFGILIFIVCLYFSQTYIFEVIWLWILIAFMLNYKKNMLNIYKMITYIRGSRLRVISFHPKFAFIHYLNVISQVSLAGVTFLFRLLIINFNGIEKSGIYFSAFALASFFPTILAGLNGPSFFFYNKKNEIKNFAWLHKLFLTIPIIIFLTSLVLFFNSNVYDFKKSLFIFTIMISIFAGYFLYFSQMKRLYMISSGSSLDTYFIDIFIAICCFLIFAIIFLFNIGDLVSPYLFLITSFISFLFYLSFEKNFSFKYLKLS